MDLGIKGRVAFIAGGSQGLGKAVATQLGKEGAKLVICALDDPELPKAVEEVRAASGAEIIGVPADLTDSEQARNFIRKGIEHFGTADILVNNAGGPPSKTFLEIDEDLWVRGFRLNLLSTITMTREVVPVLVAKRWGRIINMTSISVKQPIDDRGRTGEDLIQRTGPVQRNGKQRVSGLHDDGTRQDPLDRRCRKAGQNASGNRGLVDRDDPHGPAGQARGFRRAGGIYCLRTGRLYYGRLDPDRWGLVQRRLTERLETG